MSGSEVILVTGGASGIGLAIVDAIVEAGWRAVALDWDEAALDQTKLSRGDHVNCLRVDVTSERDVAQSIDICEQQIGPIAGVVNSAGTGVDCPALETSVDAFRRILEINLVGSFLIAREAARVMRPRQRGSIVNIASVSGVRGNAGRTAYGASKGGVIALTRVLAVEWAAYGIRVNAVAPGPVDTPLSLRVHTEAVRSKWLSAVPMRRYGTPTEIAAAALFLLNPIQSSYMTGETLCVDGGFSMAGLIPHEDGTTAPQRT